MSESSPTPESPNQNPPPGAKPATLQPWRVVVSFFSSLRLTIVLLSVSMVLVFFATIDQVHLGINQVVDIYFRSFIAYYDLRLGGGFNEELGAFVPPEPVFRLWLPGGYILGGLLLINLIAAHATRFKWTWKKSGIFLTHFGIIFLLLGELFTGLFARETQMTLDEGQTVNFSESGLEAELAFVRILEDGRERHVAIPESRLRSGAAIAHPELPFLVTIKEYFPNARLQTRDGPAPEGWADVPADQGIGPRVQWARMEKAKRMDEINLPAVAVELQAGSRSLGSWLGALQIPATQNVVAPDGSVWNMALRPRREYKNFSVTLNEFRHTRYPGTEIPKDFSSFITLTEPGLEQGRDVRIWMNHPLRHDGFTLYQHQFKNNDETSILLVVENPSWLIPYISCVIVFVGLTVQFGISLVSHLRRRASSPAKA